MKKGLFAPGPQSHASLIAGLVLVVFTGCQSCKVVRVNGGRAFCEREIEPAAYAAYARGQLAESSGDLRDALLEYDRVAKLDPHSVEAWVRIGAVQCRTNPKAAEAAWDRASELAPDSYQLWFERARCALEHGQLSSADTSARNALQFGPSKTEVTLLNARIASRLGQPEREAQLLFGALALEPTNAALWQAIMTSPTLPAHDRDYATRRFLKLRPLGNDWVPPAYVTQKAPGAVQKQTEEQLHRQLELALSNRDEKAALHFAGLLGIQSDQLALAALLAGFNALALAEANLLLTLDRNDPSAWLIAVVAADLSRANEKYETLLAHPPTSPAKLEPTLIAALMDLVQRRTQAIPFKDPSPIAGASLKSEATTASQ